MIRSRYAEPSGSGIPGRPPAFYSVTSIMSLRLESFFAASTLLLLGCPRSDPPGGGADASPSASTAQADRSPSSSANVRSTASAAAVTVDAGSLPSAKDRAAVVHDLAEGRRLSRAKDWPGAIKMFEHALTIAPDDVHVLAELGWAALQANDLSRAESANKRALANAKDPKVRASILYNSGRVAEARGEKEAAASAYRASLGLRDNAEVKKRLAALGGSAAPADATALPCASPVANVEALCSCLKGKKDEVMTFGQPLQCRAAPSSLVLGDTRLGVVLWGVDSMGERAHVLTVKEGDRLRPIAELGRDYEPGAMGVHNAATVKGAEKRSVSGHDVVVIRSEQDDSDSNLVGLELCTHHAKLETVCALGAVVGSSKCTWPIPVEVESGCGVGYEPDPADMDEETKKQLAEIKKNAKHARATTAWTLADDGTVTVKLKDGARELIEERTLAPTHLWK